MMRSDRARFSPGGCNGKMGVETVTVMAAAGAVEARFPIP